MRTAWALVLAAMLLCRAPALAQQAANWPHTVTGPNGATVVVYQPQAISWSDRTTLTARMALAITPAGAKTPVLGTIELSFATTLDGNTQLVTLSEPKLVTSHFPTLDTGQARQFEDRITAVLPTLQLKRVPLDAIVLSLKEPAPAAKAVAVNNDPPVIFHADRPASLVVFDGDPVLAPAGNSGLKFAVNTNWDIFVDPAGTWYLLNNGLWLAAPASTGPFKPVGKLPPGFSRLPADANFADARKALPPKAANPATIPMIFTSTRPAEIIVTEGAIQFAPIAGTSLQYVKNTPSDLFFDTSRGRFYYLISGRWFSAAGLDGPWTFASADLPPDFALIPPDGPRGQVLASVPGTSQAQLAVLKAQLPQQASLKRADARLTVTYAGMPEFRPIPGTELTYAVNTAFQVIGAGGRFYACYQGAWFVAATPAGPWALADSVPSAIYTIPPSSPVYNVTYVTVYGATPEAVTYGYTSGYALGFVTAGLVVYGTGYYYPPYVAAGAVPIYYPHPYSYAGSVWYNPATGGWARGGTVYGPYGGAASAGRAYNPSTGAWARGGAVYGPYGGAGAWSGYNPSTGTYAHGSAAWGPNGGTANASFSNARYGVSGSTTQNANAYSRWGSSTISGPNQTVNTASASNARGSAGAVSSSTGAAAAGVHTRSGNNAAVARSSSGNVYAGTDGNVYRHTDNGWSKWNEGGWQTMQKPAETRTQSGAGGGAASRQTLGGGSYQQLEQDRFARSEGARQFGGEGRSFGGGGGGRFRR
ncbi:MAG: hypothetical protein WDN25_03285 [Acetobacteraceae bacterium]